MAVKFSHEKVTHLSHVMVKALESAPGVTLRTDRNQVRLRALDLLRLELRRDEDMERRVRIKIESQRRAIPEGSQEWDILFRKYYEEELAKLRGARA